MHEMSIAAGIIEIVNQELKTRNITVAVERIVFRSGKLNAIVPDSLRFNFDVLKLEQEQLKETRLDIDVIALAVRCPDCDDEYEPEEVDLLCRNCGGLVEIRDGEEMRVESIVVAD